MAQAKTPAKKKKNVVSPSRAAKAPRRREIGAFVLLFLGICAFFGYFQSDGWFITQIRNVGTGLFGYGFFVLPMCLLLGAVILGFHRGRPVTFRLVCSLLIPLFFGTLLHMFTCKIQFMWTYAIVGELYGCGRELTCGGVLSGLFGLGLKPLLGKIVGPILVIFALLFLTFSSLNLTLAKIADAIRSRPRREYEPQPEAPRSAPSRSAGVKRAIDIPMDEPPAAPPPAVREGHSLFNKKPGVPTPDRILTGESTDEDGLGPEAVFIEPEGQLFKSTETSEGQGTVESGITAKDIVAPPAARKTPGKIVTEKTSRDEAAAIGKYISDSGEQQDYHFPPVDLLKAGISASVDGREEVSMNAARLEAAIRSFGISAQICNITRGPTVTRYEVELEEGVRLNRLTNLADDIALSLGASGVRIAPIPDKISIVGIEVPNKLVNTVYLREIIDSNEFRRAQSRITFAIGKDIGGGVIVGNIAKLPHLLIAGTTGSGKSVCMNSLILSLLYKSTPDEVRLIMIDPKMVELGIYNGIPHLLIPVVTDPKKASGALQWAVMEMMKRYRIFSEVGARDLAGYNDLCAKDKSGEKKPVPQIVILIDELADLMLIAAKEVEESICRIAQMGRAAGVHLVIATQRPSADVITGLMKANIPSRIAFAVSSALESRIILDTQGADKLVGRGDMLYFPLGAAKPTRIQGTFVSDGEREDVINHIKRGNQADYSEEVLHQIEKNAEGKGGGPVSAGSEPETGDPDADELLPAAVEVILESGQASVSMLQRRLKLGYSRAARLVDQMEERGIVGPFEGSKPRQLLITKQQWQEMQFIRGTAPIDVYEERPVDEDIEEAFDGEDL